MINSIHIFVEQQLQIARILHYRQKRMMKEKMQEQSHDTLSHKTPMNQGKSFAPAQKDGRYDL